MIEHLPFSGNHTVFAANAIMAECKDRLSAVQKNYTCMQREFLALDLEIPDILEIKKIEQDIEFLEQIWAVAADWDAAWESWKATSLNNLDLEDMESSTVQFNKVIVELGSEINRWNVWEH